MSADSFIGIRLDLGGSLLRRHQKRTVNRVLDLVLRQIGRQPAPVQRRARLRSPETRRPAGRRFSGLSRPFRGYESTAAPPWHGICPSVIPSPVQIQQEVVPLRFGAGKRIGYRPDRIVRTPDNFKLTVRQDLGDRKRSPCVLGCRIHGNHALRALKLCPSKPALIPATSAWPLS